MEFQTRSESTGIQQFLSLVAAIHWAKKDRTIWKISFSIGDERVRLVRKLDKNSKDMWVYEPIRIRKTK